MLVFSKQIYTVPLDSSAPTRTWSSSAAHRETSADSCTKETPLVVSGFESAAANTAGGAPRESPSCAPLAVPHHHHQVSGRYAAPTSAPSSPSPALKTQNRGAIQSCLTAVMINSRMYTEQLQSGVVSKVSCSLDGAQRPVDRLTGSVERISSGWRSSENCATTPT